MNIIRVRLATAIHIPRRGLEEAACLYQEYNKIILGAYGTRINLLSYSPTHFYVRTTWGNPVPVHQTLWGDYE